MKSVLFVCTGNTCRSPMAEALLRKRLDEAGVDGVKVWSRGIIGSPRLEVPDAVDEVLGGLGTALTGHVSERLTRADLDRAGMVLVMEGSHRDVILREFPDAAGKVFLLKEYAGLGEEDIEDPIGRPVSVYRACADEIVQCVERVAAKIKEAQ